MSGLRRSRPKDQDATLRKLQEISIARHISDTDGDSRSPINLKSSPTSEYQDYSQKQFTFDVGHYQDQQNVYAPCLKISDISTTSCELTESFSKEVSLHHDQITALKSEDAFPNCIDVDQVKLDDFDPLNNFDSNTHVIQMPHGSSSPIGKASVVNLSNNLLSSNGSNHHHANTQDVHKSTSNSRSSPSLMLKQLKLLTSSDCDSSKRGSELLCDSSDENVLKNLQLGVTDRRWEKLRSILITMKDEPLDIENLLENPTTPELDSLQHKISAQEELIRLEREISNLNIILRQKESDIAQLELERNAALEYIRKSKSTYSSNESVVIPGTLEHLYEKELQGLKLDDVTKDEVIEVTTHLMKEVLSHKAYVDQITCAVVTQAPWLLDQLKGQRSSKSTGVGLQDYDNDGDEDDRLSFSTFNESDDEVWC